jgi:hypothetical protein
MITATIVIGMALLMTLTMPKESNSKTPAEIACARSGKVVQLRLAHIEPRDARKHDSDVHAELRTELAFALHLMQVSSARLTICMERHGL